METIISDKDRVRIDHFMKELFPDYSRGYFQRLIKNGHVKINKKNTESGHRVKLGDIIEYELVNKDEKILPSEMELDVIYEDKDLIVINKRPGVVAHPAGKHQSDTLVNGLLHYWKGKFSPFLVHRLDKDTSGVIVIAKSEKSKEYISRQFQDRKVKKKYLALVEGVIKEDSGTIDAPLGRDTRQGNKIVVEPVSKRASVTDFKVLKRFKSATYLEVMPRTGRTHQIRVHLSYIKHPVMGDVEYGRASVIAKRQLLHAAAIEFNHPVSKKKVEYKADIPEDFKKTLEYLEKME